MNEKLISQAYIKVKPIADKWDAEIRAKWKKPPLWRRAAHALGWKRPLVAWLTRREKRHVMAIHAARKAAARAYIEAGEAKAKRKRAEKAKER